MKKIIFIIVAVVSFSLSSKAQFKIGIKAGGSLDNQKVNVTEGSIYSGSDLKGYHAGLIAEVNIGRNFYVQPQLLFSRKGAMHLSSVGNGDSKIRLSYVELPVNVLRKFDLSFGKIFIGAGGVFSYAVSGKEEQGGLTKKLYAGGVKDWRREDISLSFTAGLELNNGLFASINSQKGLLDIHTSSDLSVKNKSMSISVGYLLNWKKLRRKS